MIMIMIMNNNSYYTNFILKHEDSIKNTIEKEILKNILTIQLTIYLKKESKIIMHLILNNVV